MKTLFERMLEAMPYREPEVQPLKAVSLWQPWASAVPLGYKGIETRHWQTKYRGDIAIHAAKKFGPEERRWWAALVRSDPTKWPDLPALGAIIAVANLAQIQTATDLRDMGMVTSQEESWGNYEAFTMVKGVPRQRYGWVLDHVRPLREPVLCVGRQSIWTLPADVAAMVRGNIDQVPA